MERKIGEIFKYEGEWCQCVESTGHSCIGCVFRAGANCKSNYHCNYRYRRDKMSVIFKKLEKVIEPFKGINGAFKRYKLETPLNGDIPEEVSGFTNTEVVINTKQTKEDMEEKEHYIGDIWGSNGWYYKCVPQEDEKMRCQGCVFAECGSEHCEEWHGGCSKEKRNDGKNVIFKRLKEVWKNTYWGEPKWCDGDVYETFEDACEAGRAQGDRYITSENIANKYGYVERDVNVKKDEGMEEKKLKLKPFDLQKAKNGKPVCTRDGRKARIICFDRCGNKPIVALVTTDDREYLTEYYCDGRISHNSAENNDLMMLPEKKEGWVHIRKDIALYETMEEAERTRNDDNYVSVKVEWEE